MTSVLSIGSNIGDRLSALQAAIEILEPYAVSPVYESTPVGGPPQGDYLNAVLLCDYDAGEAWDRAQQAERARGRERRVRWGPRSLDVDVIVADGAAPEAIILPHPRAHERGFVLVPWHDIDADAVLPGHGPIADLIASLGTDGVDLRDDLRLVLSKES